MEIRLARPADLRPVGELTVAAYADFTRGPEDPYVERLRDAGARAFGAELWLAERAGHAIGTVTVCPPGSPWREISRPDEGEFRMLAVSPAARGHGVGEALVRPAIQRFAAAGVHDMAISSLAGMAAAHRMYDRLGFLRAPARDWSPAPDVDLLAYELHPLPPS